MLAASHMGLKMLKKSVQLEQKTETDRHPYETTVMRCVSANVDTSATSTPHCRAVNPGVQMSLLTGMFFPCIGIHGIAELSG